jgi:centriolar protein POC1
MRPYKFIGHKGPVHDVAISPNGNLIASASGDETVRVWNNGVNGNSQTIKAHVAPVKSVDFNNDGRLLLTGSDDKIIKIINVADRKFQASLIGHNNWVKCARFSPDSRLVGSASDDHTVKLWDVAQKTTIHTYIDHLEDVNTVRFHPDGTCIASGSVDKKIKIWDIRSKRLIQHYDAHSSSVTCISFHPSGNYLISASMDATLKIWDLKMGQILYTLYGHEGPVTTVNFSNCGDFFCSGGVDSILMVWKSNVKNMDQEFENMSKSDTKMKSNRIKIDEDFSIGNTRAIKGIAQGLKKSVTNVVENNNKFNVTKEEKKVTMKSSLPVSGRNEPSIESSNMFGKLPPELSSTFEKMISQLDIIANTMKIMDQRIATVENQISEIMINRRKNTESVREDSKKSTKSAKEENFAMSGNYYENLKLSRGDNYINKNLEYEYKNNQPEVNINL